MTKFITFLEHYKLLNENFNNIDKFEELFYSLNEDAFYGFVVDFGIECLENILPQYKNVLTPNAIEVVNRTIRTLQNHIYSSHLYLQLVNYSENDPENFAFYFAVSRLLYSAKENKDYRHYMVQFLDELYHIIKFPLEKIVEIFKKHLNRYMQEKFQVSFDPEWKTSTVVSLGKNYLLDLQNKDYLDKMNDALQDAGLDDIKIIENFNIHNRIFGIWIGMNVI